MDNQHYKTGLYVIYDKVAQQSGPVMELVNDEVAKRITKKMLKEAKLEKDEVILYLIGRYNNETVQLFRNNNMEIDLGDME